MITALSSGGLGDIVYSIPVMRQLQVQALYVKKTNYRPEYGTLYSAINTLVKSQGFDCRQYPDLPQFTYDEALPTTYDLDRFREQPMRGLTHIMISLRNQFNIEHAGWKKPWLNIEGTFEFRNVDHTGEPYTIIHLTERWRRKKLVNWKEVVARIKTKIFFVGFQHEWIDFCSTYCDVPWLPTDDILDLALLIKGAEAVYCNQSVSLALAQGLGKEYFLERNPGKTNTLLQTSNEHLL